MRVFENRGRDIGPFLTGFGEAILDRYDIVGHVHTKKSIGFGIDAEVLNGGVLESIASLEALFFMQIFWEGSTPWQIGSFNGFPQMRQLA